MTNKIGVFSLPARMTGPEAVRYAASIGAAAFEPLASLAEPEPSAEEAARTREEADKLGIALPCFSVGISVTGETVEAAVKRLKGCADAAKIMGIPLLHHTICSELRSDAPLRPFDELLEEALPRVREVFDYAASLGIRCVYEDQGFYFNGEEHFSMFLNALDRPAGVVLDLGNIGFVHETADRFARRFADKILHVHAKDYKFFPYSPERPGYRIDDNMLCAVLPGDGDMRVPEALAVLKETGYAGYLMLENENHGDPYAEQKAYLERMRELTK